MSDKPTSADRFLDFLLDALLERQAARRAQATQAVSHTAAPLPPRPESGPGPAAHAPAATAGTARPAPPRQPSEREPKLGEEGWQPPPRLPSIDLGKTLARLLVLVALLIVAVNVPITSHGLNLAHVMPDSATLVIRDGLILKGSGPEIYRLEKDELRWISSVDAFEHLGLAWKDVHVVEDSFLAKFELGQPIHVLLKCDGSPHIYRLENQHKRWIKDIDTFLAEGHVWEDVRLVSCEYLRQIPDGPPIPEDAGPPPQP